VSEEPFLGSAVYNRLKLYLREIGADEGETPHSFRAGCSLTLALLGIPKASIAQHVGWASTSMVEFYNDLSGVLTSEAPAAALATCVSGNASSQLSAAYKSLDDISAFKLVFS
jgi:integrase